MFFFESRQSIRVDCPVVNYLGKQVRVSGQTIFGNEGRQILDCFLVVGSRGVGRGQSARLDTFDGRFGNGVGVIPDVVLDPDTAFAHVVSPDLAAVLQVNDVGRGTHRCDRYEEETAGQQVGDTRAH